MPIVYVHGVATRDPKQAFFEIERFLRRFIAPVISDTPDKVSIEQAFWGDAGAKFAWEGASRPRSLLLGQGTGDAAPSAADRAILAAALKASLDRVPAPREAPASRLTSGRTTAAAVPAPIRLKDLVPSELSDLLADLLATAIEDPELRVKATLAADALANDAAFHAALAAAPHTAAECDLIVARLRAELPGGLAPMGAAGDWLRGVGDRLGEAASRALSLPGATASVVAGELRKGLNDFVALFLGDVFAYLDGRFDEDRESPGRIPRCFLDALGVAQANQVQRGDEPIVVLSHSMGGQIVYDALTHFLPRDARFNGLRIDFWCATASQVGFFEEAKFFVASRDEFKAGHQVPFPAQHLGAWWNVWDYNDFISFTTKGIIAGVDDESYSSGMSLIGAHSGYLQRPSFYRHFADRLGKAIR